jgi:hypothetical protein
MGADWAAAPGTRRQEPGAAGDAVLDEARRLPGCLGRYLLVQTVGGAFGQPPVVGEDQRRVVLLDEVQHTRDDDRPYRLAGQVAEILDHRLDLQRQRLLVPRVDDCHRPWHELRLSVHRPLTPTQESRDLV